MYINNSSQISSAGDILTSNRINDTISSQKSFYHLIIPHYDFSYKKSQANRKDWQECVDKMKERERGKQNNVGLFLGRDQMAVSQMFIKEDEAAY